VIALKTFIENKKAERPKQPLVETPDTISCIITRKKIPGKFSLKPIQM
jgi:hypothetical protein